MSSVNRRSLEDVEKIMNSRPGYQLLKYTPGSGKLDFKCPEGHLFKMAFTKFKVGQSCSICQSSKNKKRTIDEVNEILSSRGFQLVSTEYKGLKNPLNAICPNGHQVIVRLGNFIKGFGCAKCYGNKKLEIEEVRGYISKFGYSLLSTEYTNNRQKISILCPKGHTYITSFSHFKGGSRCTVCNGSIFPLEKEEIIRRITEKGFRWVSGVYENQNSPKHLGFYL
jgi:hypothetical protein